MSKPAAEPASLTVTLAGRPYPLRVDPKDEEAIRRIAKELNDKVVDYQKGYVGRDKQDCLAMLLLVYAVDLYKVKDGATPASTTLPEEAASTLRRMERDVTAALESSQAPPDEADGPA